MSEPKISEGLHGQLARVEKTGACHLNAPLKIELSLLNEHLFGFKLNTYCQTCILDAMHKVNNYIRENQQAVEVVIDTEEIIESKGLEVILPEGEFSDPEKEDMKEMFEDLSGKKLKVSEGNVEEPTVVIPKADPVEPKKAEHKSVEVYSKSFLKKKSLGELQTLAEKINKTEHEPKVPEFTTKGQGVNAMAGIPKIK